MYVFVQQQQYNMIAHQLWPEETKMITTREFIYFIERKIKSPAEEEEFRGQQQPAAAKSVGKTKQTKKKAKQRLITAI